MPTKSKSANTLPADQKRYLTATQVMERYGGMSHMWLVRILKKDRNFPRPIKFGDGRLRYFDLDKLERYERAAAAKTEA